MRKRLLIAAVVLGAMVVATQAHADDAMPGFGEDSTAPSSGPDDAAGVARDDAPSPATTDGGPEAGFGADASSTIPDATPGPRLPDGGVPPQIPLGSDVGGVQCALAGGSASDDGALALFAPIALALALRRRGRRA